MSELQDLYQQVIVDHSKYPRNFKVLEGANHQGEGYNPLCGDKVTIYLNIENGIVKDVTFQGSGCAISTASASVMTDAIKGKPITEFESLFSQFHKMVTGKGEVDTESLGKLAIFEGVSQFPTRVKCASLAWHTLKNALNNTTEVAKTE